MTELVLQPDETASQDTYLSQSAKDTAYGSSNRLLSRSWNSGFEAFIPLIKFDLTSLPAGATVSAASLAVTLAATATRTTSPTWRRILPANSGWVEGATWNYANPTAGLRWSGDTGGDGSNAGCRVSGTDYSATPIGSFSMTATSDVAGTVYTSALDLTEFGYMIANNCGFILLYQSGGLESIHSSGATTEANRPKLTITYTEAGIPKHAMYYARMRGNL